MKFLLIRNDNIGDLACTTPLIEVLRKAYPEATIDLLGNEYNIDLLRHDPRISRLWSYGKAKHVHGLWKKIYAWIHKVIVLLQLRQQCYDTVIITVPVFNKRTTGLARWIRPQAIYGAPSQQHRLPKNYHPVVIAQNNPHVLQVLTYARALGINLPAPEAMSLFLSAEEKKSLVAERALARIFHTDSSRGAAQHDADKADEDFGAELYWTYRSSLNRSPTQSASGSRKPQQNGDQISGLVPGKSSLPIIGLQISARRPKQRWTFEQWKKFIESLLPHAHLRLLWSPGSAVTLQHPGDDELASQLSSTFPSLLVKPTSNLRSLMVSFFACDLIVGSDGGAMHIAAALDIPTITLFGDIDPTIWQPYSKKGVIIASPTDTLADLDPVTVSKKVIEIMSLSTYR